MIHCDDGGAHLRLRGNFDGAAALALRDQLMEAHASRIVIDFGAVDAFDDSTLALLTVYVVLLRRRGRTVTLRGLGAAQREALQHFGL
ncbi:MAG TPA: STAS domain-containing protein [Myxococcales bacterium]|nr:STAS domain-containing protein [Myxococcales bacterium]